MKTSLISAAVIKKDPAGVIVSSRMDTKRKRTRKIVIDHFDGGTRTGISHSTWTRPAGRLGIYDADAHVHVH